MKKRVTAMLAVCLLLTGCKKTDAVALYLAEGIAQQIAWMDDIPFTDGPDMGYDDIGSNWTTPQTESGAPGSVYDEIYKEIESGNYRQAQSKLEAAINRYGNDDHFAELSEMLHTGWAAEVFAEAADAFENGYDYESAIRIIQASGLYGDDVDAEIAKYQEYAPVMLKEFEPVKKTRGIEVYPYGDAITMDINGHVYDGETVIAPYKNTYDDVAKSESDAYITYYLYRKYRIFDAVLYRTYESLSVSPEDWPQETVAKIYGDDVLLYEGPAITQNTYEEYKIHADISGVRELKIVLLGVGLIPDTWPQWYSPVLAIADVTVQK